MSHSSSPSSGGEAPGAWDAAHPSESDGVSLPSVDDNFKELFENQQGHELHQAAALSGVQHESGPPSSTEAPQASLRDAADVEGEVGPGSTHAAQPAASTEASQLLAAQTALTLLRIRQDPFLEPSLPKMAGPPPGMSYVLV